MTSDPLSLQEIQQANLSALVEIDRICRENRLRYFLAYGTLIGAVRHHGFIPWDDDVDIFMPRKDYDALHMILGDGIVNGFKLCTRANTKHYPYYIPRFCNMRYRYETEQKEPIFDIGAFVDIYPLDNYCSDIEHGRKLVRRIRRMNATYMLYNKGAIGKNGLVRAASSVASILLHLAEGKKLPERINGRIDRFLLANTSDQDTYVGVPAWTYGLTQYDRELFDENTELPFEGHLLSVPKEYDAVLSKLYGDYMALPPEEERKATHHYSMYVRDGSIENNSFGRTE